MNSIIKKIALKIATIFKVDIFARRSWSQEGEDLILARLFENINIGCYVDVGAHDPRRFSNTYKFYKRGWNGVNIDARPGTKVLFDKIRPRDINVETGVGSTRRILKYYMFGDPAYNGFDETISHSRSNNAISPIVDVKNIEVIPLGEVLEQVLPAGTPIDFMTVDVEGMDYDVLVSNDWANFRPTYILVEVIGGGLDDMAGCNIATLLCEKGYVVFAKTVQTFFFKRID